MRMIVSAESPERVARLAVDFRRRHWSILPAVIDSRLLARVQGWMQSSTFFEQTFPTGNTEFSPHDHRAANALRFLANDDGVFRDVRAITGCGPIAGFEGRVYRYEPGRAHGGHWHNDMLSGRRMIAMSINLSAGPFEGGELELRRKNETTLLASVRNVGRGDALLFSISSELEHRVLPVVGDTPKLSFAGWFLSA